MRATRFFGMALVSLWSIVAHAHDPEALDVRIASKGATLAGTLLLPDEERRFPCVVLAGGTLSPTRDGGLTDLRKGECIRATP